MALYHQSSAFAGRDRLVYIETSNTTFRSMERSSAGSTEFSSRGPLFAEAIMHELLKGRVAVITGAGRGLGRAFAMAMASQGARILVNDLGCCVDGLGHSAQPADDVVKEIRELGGTAVANYDSIA